MRIFLARTALFCFVLVLLFLAASAGERFLRTSDRQEEQRMFMELHGGKTHVILGDSHAAVGIDASELPEDWISFAYPADNLFDSFAKLLFLAKHNPVQVVLLPIDYHIITQFREKNRNICSSLKLLSNEDAHLVWNLSPVITFFMRARCMFPLLEKIEREKLMIVLTEKLRSLGTAQKQPDVSFTTEGGWVTTDPGLRLTLTPDAYRAAAADVVRRQLTDTAVVPSLLAVYQEMIRFAHDRNMRVIGIRYPLDPAYLSFLPAQKTEEIETALATLDFDARYDWSELLKDSPSSFYNSDHLNTSGALLLTRTLVSCLPPQDSSTIHPCTN